MRAAKWPMQRRRKTVAFRLAIDDVVRSAAGMSRRQISRLRRAAVTADPVLEQRKALKKLRSLFGLLRTPETAKSQRRCLRLLREECRALGVARDRTAMRATLERLVGDGLVRKASLRKTLTAQLVAPLPGGHASLADVDSIAAAIEQFRFREVTLESVIDEASKGYRAARRGLRDAIEAASGEAFHDCRKLVQRHARHLQVLGDLAPDDLAQRLAETKALARMLGEDHDLQVFADWLAGADVSAKDRAEAERLAAGIERIQQRLRREAADTGQQLFALRTRHFRARLLAGTTEHPAATASAKATPEAD